MATLDDPADLGHHLHRVPTNISCQYFILTARYKRWPRATALDRKMATPDDEEEEEEEEEEAQVSLAPVKATL